jgi:nucleoside phosphorylase
MELQRAKLFRIMFIRTQEPVKTAQTDTANAHIILRCAASERYVLYTRTVLNESEQTSIAKAGGVLNTDFLELKHVLCEVDDSLVTEFRTAEEHRDDG